MENAHHKAFSENKKKLEIWNYDPTEEIAQP